MNPVTTAEGRADERLSACRRVRRGAADALHRALGDARRGSSPISEHSLRDAWLHQLRSDPSIHRDGWYIPPPHGIGVIVADDRSPERLTFGSLRGMVARTDVELEPSHGVVYAYASPVDRATGVIGDFAVTLYLGADPRLREHVAAALDVDRCIVERVAVGSRFRDLARYGHSVMRDRGISHALVSSTDPMGDNMGHTVPGIHDPWMPGDPPLCDAASWPEVCGAISRRRRFLNTEEDFSVRPGMAFTVEPRPSGPGLPMVSFHTIAGIREDGTKEWLTDYDDLFAWAGMDGWIAAGSPVHG